MVSRIEAGQATGGRKKLRSPRWVAKKSEMSKKRFLVNGTGKEQVRMVWETTWGEHYLYVFYVLEWVTGELAVLC